VGQPITVVERRSSRPGIYRYEINRTLTGMGHERYRAGELVDGDRPVDELARRLLAHGGIDAIHVNGSVITVELARGYNSTGIADVIRDLYIFYVQAGDTATEPDAADDAATEPAPTS
jgi:hypothetical protein